MARKRKNHFEEDDLAASWYAPPGQNEMFFEHDETVISIDSEPIFSEGNPRAYRLDLRDMQSQLIRSYPLIQTKYDAFAWVTHFGLPAGTRSNRVSEILDSASSLKALIELNSAVKKASTENNYKALKGLLRDTGDTEYRYFQGFSNAFYIEHGQFAGIPIDLIQFDKAFKNKTDKKQEEYLLHAARRQLSFCSNFMLKGIQPFVFWGYPPVCNRGDEKVLQQTYMLSYPWQAIALGFIELVRDCPLNLKYCSRPACGKPLINKRFDARSCGTDSRCDHYVERYLPRVRKYNRQVA